MKTGQGTEAPGRDGVGGGVVSGMGRRRKRGSEQTGLVGVEKIRNGLLDARTRLRGSDE
jgi:hypothetical protein